MYFISSTLYAFHITPKHIVNMASVSHVYYSEGVHYIAPYTDNSKLTDLSSKTKKCIIGSLFAMAQKSALVHCFPKL